MKARVIHTKFWKDQYIGELNPTEKLFFLYLISNENIGLTGIYECPDRVMQFDTGLSSTQVEDLKEKFTKDNKFLFCNGWVKVVNVDKYQNFTGKSNEIAKERELELVPEVVINYFEGVSRGGQDPVHGLSNKKQVINNKKQVISNKKMSKKNVDNSVDKSEVEEIESELTEIRDHYNQVFGRNTTSMKAYRNNYKNHWRGVHDLPKIKRAIENAARDDWWKDKLTLEILFRKRNPRGEDTDKIEMLAAKNPSNLPEGVL